MRECVKLTKHVLHCATRVSLVMTADCAFAPGLLGLLQKWSSQETMTHPVPGVLQSLADTACSAGVLDRAL